MENKESWNRRYEQGYWINIKGQDRFNTISKYLPDKKNDGVCLEIGSAIGGLTRYLSPLFSKVISCEISSVAIEKAKVNNKDLTNIEYICGNFLDIDIPPVDYIVALDCLYYMLGERLKEKLLKASKPGTIIIIEEVAHTDPAPTALSIPIEFKESKHIIGNACDIWVYRHNSGIKYNTDKVKSGFLAEYENIFQHLRDEKIKYLEVGVKYGGSLMWAKDFFSSAKGIYGIDINPPIIIPGTTVFQVDQNNSAALDKVGIENGPFDIIIDDGCHREKETQNTITSLFEFLKVGGYYVIEDWVAVYIDPEFIGMDKLVTSLARLIGNGKIIINGSHSYAIYRRTK